MPEEMRSYREVDEAERRLREEEPEVLALSRTNYPAEKPSGKKLELIRQQMMRVHRAAGHPSFQNLVKLLKARKAPEWAISMAGSLQCPDCIESKRPLPHPPAGDKGHPSLWEIVGTDVFEFEGDVVKYKFMIWRDRASGYIFVDHLQTYKGNWEPTSKR